MLKNEYVCIMKIKNDKHLELNRILYTVLVVFTKNTGSGFFDTSSTTHIQILLRLL